MRKVPLLVVMLAVGVVWMPAGAATVWSCTKAGRLVGPPSPWCVTTLPGDAYRFLIHPQSQESGDVEVYIEEIGGEGYVHVTCSFLLGRWQYCDASLNRCCFVLEDQGASLGGRFFFESTRKLRFEFRVRPPFCQAAACDTEQTIPFGEFRVDLATSDQF